MNPKENKDDAATIEYSEKHGCTIAAAKLLLARTEQSKEKSQK